MTPASSSGVSGSVVLHGKHGASTEPWEIHGRLRQLHVLPASASRQEAEAFIRAWTAPSASPRAGWLNYEFAPFCDPALVVHRVPPDTIIAAWGEVEILPPDAVAAPTMLSAPVSDAAYSIDCDALAYAEHVAAILEEILAGNLYELNYSVRYSGRYPADVDMDTILSAYYKTLTHRLKPIHGAFIRTDRASFVSASPELFLSKRGQQITTRPIKGSAGRHGILEQDASIAQELRDCPKNAAEHTMVVDMARNDLGRVCLPHTVHVQKYKALETYPAVHHLVSTVQGQLRPGLELWDVLCATFPAASITGAPKVQVMQSIRKYEQSPRGVYTGSIGVVWPNGDYDFNVAIRTLEVTHSQAGHTWRLGSGGAIVADSDPAAEWSELQMKAAPLLAALLV